MDNALTNEGERVVSDTLPLTVDSENLPTIKLTSSGYVVEPQQKEKQIHMKKPLTHILFCLLLLTLFLPVSVKAEEKNRAEMTVTDHQVGISLEIPAGKTDAIHSLRVKISVTSSDAGELSGTFAFHEGISSIVQDAAWMKKDTGYVMDLILSGKQDLIGENGILSLGTLSLSSDSKN